MAYIWQVTYQNQSTHKLDLSPGLSEIRLSVKTLFSTSPLFYFYFFPIFFFSQFFPSVYVSCLTIQFQKHPPPPPKKKSGYFVQIKFERDDLINQGVNVQILIFPIVKVTGVYQGNERKNEWRTRRSPYLIQTSNCVFTIPKQLVEKQKGQLIN